MTFLAALRFLTIFRLGWLREPRLEELKRSAGYFPLVGVIIGLVLVGLNWLLSLLLPPPVVNILLIVALVIITGALHLDGFLDTCDGIGGHRTPEERWQIMDDSRAGGFGVIGVSCLLLTKYISLNSIPGSLLTATLVLMPVAGRWAMVYAIFAYPYAKPSGLGKTFQEETDWQALTLATITALAVAIGWAWWGNLAYFYLVGPAVLAATWLLIVLVATCLKRKFAGLTGDTYGAINEITEVWILILVSMLAHSQWLNLA